MKNTFYPKDSVSIEDYPDTGYDKDKFLTHWENSYSKRKEQERIDMITDCLTEKNIYNPSTKDAMSLIYYTPRVDALNHGYGKDSIKNIRETYGVEKLL